MATVRQPDAPRGRANIRVLLLAAASVAAGIWILTQVTSPAEDPLVVFRRGLAAILERGDLSVATDAARSLEGVSGYESHRRLLQGGELLRSGRPEDALPYFAALEPGPDTETPGRVLAGECLYRLGRFGEARLCLEPVLDDPEYAGDAHRLLAAVAYDLGANAAALEHLQQLMQLEPDDYRAFHLAGLMHYDFSQYQEAEENYRQALERDPPLDVRPDIVEGLARTLIERRSYADCVELLESEPETATTLALHSTCLIHLGEADAAQQKLAEAERNDPDNVEVRRARARFLLDEGSNTEARAVLSALVGEHPADYQLRYDLALACARCGDDSAAEAELARAAELRSAYERLSELSTAAIDRPQDAGVRIELAQVCRELGKDRLAEVWERAAAALEGTAPVPE